MDPWSQVIVAASARTAPRVVGVTAVDPERTQVALGTGFVLNGRYVLTHSHIYSPGDRVTVALRDGQRLEAEMAAADPLYLLAVLRLEREIDFAAPVLTPREELLPGLLVLALGCPYQSEFSLSSGTISTPDRTIYRPERFPVDGLIVTDAAVHLGNIGGPLIDLEGRLAGINGTPMAGGLSLAVQAEVVMRLVQQMLEHGRATHPWLGFRGQPETVPPAMATLLQLPVQEGVAVTDVVEGGPGDRAGVQPLDLVVAMDGHPVTSLGAIRRTLAEHRPGESCALTVLRAGDLQELPMPVEEMPRLAATPWGDSGGSG